MVKKIVKVLIEKLGVTLEDSKLEALIGLRMVNMNYYPTCPDPELTVGVGRHSDMGTLTVLLQDGIGGLYVKLEEDMDGGKRGEWMEITPVPGALVINIGDTLQVSSLATKFIRLSFVYICFMENISSTCIFNLIRLWLLLVKSCEVFEYSLVIY